MLTTLTVKYIQAISSECKSPKAYFIHISTEHGYGNTGTPIIVGRRVNRYRPNGSQFAKSQYSPHVYTLNQ